MRHPWRHVLAAGLILSALNALKPVHVDDPAYLYYGAQFAAHPLDPYGFQFGSPYAAAATQLLVPPVVPYWLGAGMWLLGDDPALLKWWLLPFALLLAWTIDVIGARVAPTLRAPLLWLCVLSPTFLPGFNFMLDVPVAALGLAALVAAMRSAERDSLTLALLASLLAALAVETKYTGLIACATILVWCALAARPARGVAIAVLAVVFVVGWEMVVAWTHGESHFLVHLRQRQPGAIQRWPRLLLPLLSHVAGLAPAVALLGRSALGWPARRVLAAGVGMLSAFAVLAMVPSQEALVTNANGTLLLTPSNVVYGVLIVMVWTALSAVCLHLAQRSRNSEVADRLIDTFLLAWLVLELVGYFGLSPSPGARRVNGVVLVFSLLACRLAHLQNIRRRAAAWIAACGVAFAVGVFATDRLDAVAERAAARAVAERGLIPAAGGTFWHASWSGVRYYADREGLLALELNRLRPRPGDLLAVHDLRELREAIALDVRLPLELVDVIAAGDGFPLRVAPGYYTGRTPIENQRGPRTRVLIYRVGRPADAR